MGPLARGIHKDAALAGLSVDSLIDCELEGNSIACEPDSPDNAYLLSIYNPNIRPINGIYLKRKQWQLEVQIAVFDRTRAEFVEAQVEVYCPNGEDCLIFISSQLAGMSFTYIKIKPVAEQLPIVASKTLFSSSF